MGIESAGLSAAFCAVSGVSGSIAIDKAGSEDAWGLEGSHGDTCRGHLAAAGTAGDHDAADGARADLGAHDGWRLWR